jgi:hypothetical protein
MTIVTAPAVMGRLQSIGLNSPMLQRQPGKEGSDMKKVYFGKIYDSKTATKVLSVSGGSTPLTHFQATLYQTPVARSYFLVGSGGPLSRFAQSVGRNEFSGGDDLIPLTPDQAKEFLHVYQQR